MKLRHIVLAEKVILERDDLSATAIGILFELNAFVQDSAGNRLNHPEFLPFEYTLLTVWDREDEPEGTYPTEMAFIAPDGSTILRALGSPVIFTLPTERRFLGRVMIKGLPYRDAGEYRLEVYKGESKAPSGAWTFVMKVIDEEVPEGQVAKLVIQPSKAEGRTPASPRSA